MLELRQPSVDPTHGAELCDHQSLANRARLRHGDSSVRAQEDGVLHVVFELDAADGARLEAVLDRLEQRDAA